MGAGAPSGSKSLSRITTSSAYTKSFCIHFISSALLLRERERWILSRSGRPSLLLWHAPAGGLSQNHSARCRQITLAKHPPESRDAAEYIIYQQRRIFRFFAHISTFSFAFNVYYTSAHEKNDKSATWNFSRTI
jgi:hypothetical protein